MIVREEARSTCIQADFTESSCHLLSIAMGSMAGEQEDTDHGTEALLEEDMMMISLLELKKDFFGCHTIFAYEKVATCMMTRLLQGSSLAQGWSKKQTGARTTILVCWMSLCFRFQSKLHVLPRLKATTCTALLYCKRKGHKTHGSKN